MSQPEVPAEAKAGKTVTIVVNGRPRTVEKNATLSFAEVVELAYPGCVQNEKRIFTVTYAKGEDKKPQGSLVAGESVKVKEGMVFNVVKSDKS